LLHLTEMNTGEVVAPGAPMSLPALSQRSSSVDHIALNCKSLDLMLTRLEQFQVPFTRTEVPAVNEIQLFLRDPTGNGIELIFAVENS
jgi:hypothetical protein